MTREENQKRQKELFENPLLDTYRTFMQGKARWGYVFVTDTWAKYQTIWRYGKAKLVIDLYVDPNGAITDMVFDVRDIFDAYKDKKENVIFNAKTHEVAFINYADIVENLNDYSKDHYFKIRDYKHGYEEDVAEDEDEPFLAMGISLVDYYNDGFNKYTPWAAVMFEFLEALDEALGFEGKEKKNRITRQEVDKRAARLPVGYWVITFLIDLLFVGAILLIVLGIIGKIPAWCGWVFGILLALPTLPFGIVFTKELWDVPKQYKTNTGDMEKKCIEPTKSAFIVDGGN